MGTMNMEAIKAIKDFIKQDEVNLPLGGNLLSVDSQNNYYLSDSKCRILKFNRNPYERSAIYEFDLPNSLSVKQLKIESIAVNPSGQHIIMSGTQQDHAPLLLLMDTADGRPINKQQLKKQFKGLLRSENDGSNKQTSSSQVFKCPVCEVDAGVFKNMVGLQVLQIQWHPHSSIHFAVLLADNDFRLYKVSNLQRVEQSITLRFGITRRLGLYNDHRSNDVIRFEFSRAEGYAWSMFTVYFLRADGGIFAMCPIAPFGMPVHEAEAKTLLNTTESNSGARAWVKQTLLPANLFDAEGQSDDNEIVVLARPFLNHVVMLQGPLNNVQSMVQELEVDPQTSQKVFPQLALNSYISEEGYSTSFGIVASNGKVGFLWQSQEVLPLWQQAEPTVIKNQAGRVVQIQWEAQAIVSGEENVHLIDVIDTGLQASKFELDVIDEYPFYTPIRLFSTTLFTEGVYVCVSKVGSLIVKLPWQKQFAELVEADGDPDLNEVEEIQIHIIMGQCTQNDRSDMKHVMVGLSSSNLNLYAFEIVSLLSNGKVRMMVQDIEELGYGAEVEDFGLNDNNFSSFTPRPTVVATPPQVSNQNKRTIVPQGLNMTALVASMGNHINNLTETYLNFLHTAHYDMKRRMKELRELPDLEPEAMKIEEMYKEVLRRNDSLQSRIVHAKEVSGNLQERFELMKEVSLLNMSLQQELSNSEVEFKHELADMYRQNRVLAEKCKQLRKQFTEGWRRDVDGGRGMSGQGQPSRVSSVSISNVKEVLEAQNKTIQEVMEQLRIIERTVNEETAKLN
eukprot:TRINITY_DN4523_c0_g2_i1.p1 TRINITY_DN4523_c0_g2~~TRINITY_DN4523_c0_g2_i1.p1  ORF type:complete len:790 (+),score=107.46 TRINITY_DN4523_c0_g2_i1:206-2575(+)